MRAFQSAFVALVTDAAVRREFEADAGSVLRSLEVEGRAAEALLGIDRRALARYAQSLVAKRWRALRDTAPLTLSIHPALGRVYRAWAETHPDPGDADMRLSPGAAEGLRALAPLRQALAGDELAAVYAPDLLTYEVYGAATRRDHETRTFRARYAVQSLVADLRGGLIPIDPPPEPTWIRFEPGRVRWKAA